MTITQDVQRFTDIDGGKREDIPEITYRLDRGRKLQIAIKHQLITETAFKLYVGGSMEQYLRYKMPHEDLYALYIEKHNEANRTLKTSYKPMRIHDSTKRLKRCKHCNKLFFDMSLRNQAPCCNRNVAYDKDNRLMQRNGVILSKCYQEFDSKRKRTTDDNRSVPLYLERNIDGLLGKLDNAGNIVTDGKVRRNRKRISVKLNADYIADTKPSSVTVYSIDELNRNTSL